MKSCYITIAPHPIRLTLGAPLATKKAQKTLIQYVLCVPIIPLLYVSLVVVCPHGICTSTKKPLNHVCPTAYIKAELYVVLLDTA